MRERASRGKGGRARHPWWRDVGTAVAVSGLLVTLLFNTIGVWRAKDQAEGSRIATEVGLLTQVGAGVNDAEVSITRSGLNDKACDAVPTPSDADEATLHEVLLYYDHLAWLFNQEHVRQPSAKEYWRPNLRAAYVLGVKLKGQEEIDDLYPELFRLVRAAPKELRAAAQELCP